MKMLSALIGRNTKLFFKDKGMFFTSLITPMILLVLYGTFLGNVYRSSFKSGIPQFLQVPDKLVNGCVAAQLFSSLLAVSCVTVAFCSNMLMVQDKVNGSRRDLTVSPVKSSTLAVSYYISTFLTTLIVCLSATGICFLYTAKQGWYMSVKDVFAILLDVVMLVMFGTVLSSIINSLLSTQGQISAVGTIVSSAYGFVCGAYMPISQFNDGLQRVISFLPGTYATSLLRNHALGGVFDEMKNQGFPPEVIEGIRDSVDCNLYFFDNKVETAHMYAILSGSIAVLFAVYIIMNKFVLSKKR